MLVGKLQLLKQFLALLVLKKQSLGHTLLLLLLLMLVLLSLLVLFEWRVMLLRGEW